MEAPVENGTTEAPKMKWWHIAACTALALLISSLVFFILGGGRSPRFFRSLYENLPLALPILTLLLAVLLRPQQLFDVPGLLRLANPLSLGIVNFSIWYLVTAQGATSKYIRVGPESVLSVEYAVLVFIVAFMWAGFCSVITALVEDKANRKWRFLQAALLAISLAALRLPFVLPEDKAAVEKKLGISLDARSFTVNIPYRDPSLNAYLGRTTDPLDQCQTYRHISAHSTDEAVQAALARLKESPSYYQFARTIPRGKEGTNRKPVEVVESGISAQQE